MESREIVIIVKGTQRKQTIMSAATTLGELKQDMRANNIDFDDECVFYEGVSKSEFTHDNAFLPHDVPYKGQITNKLVFMLTYEGKKIKSGGMSRGDIYSTIKENGLQDEIKKAFGRNFTQVSTESLLYFIERLLHCNSAINNSEGQVCSCSQSDTEENKFMRALIFVADYINTHKPEFAFWKTKFGTEYNINDSEVSLYAKEPYSCEEIEDMFEDIM